MTARAVQPRNTDPIAFLQVCNTRAERDNDSRSLMSGRDGKNWLHRPIAIRRVQVGVANPTRDDFYQGLTRPRRRYRKLSHHERLAEPFNDCCSHSCRYWHTPSSLEPITDSCVNYRAITLSVGILMRLEHRQIDIRQNPSMLELIQVHVDCAQIIDLAHRCLYHVALREGQHVPTITEMCRGVSALCGAPT